MIYGTTGHRDIVKDEALDIALIYLEWFEKGDVLIAGGASGWDDLIANEAMMQGKKLWLYIPYQALPCDFKLRKYAEVTKVSNINHGIYHVSNYFIRNQWIVDDATELLAYWDGRLVGGTYDTIKRARKKEMRILNHVTPKKSII